MLMLSEHMNAFVMFWAPVSTLFRYLIEWVVTVCSEFFDCFFLSLLGKVCCFNNGG